MTIAWLVCLAYLSARPQWLITLWGGGITWEEVHSVMIMFFGVFKLILFVGVLGTIWVTIWARKLKRLSGAA